MSGGFVSARQADVRRPEAPLDVHVCLFRRDLRLDDHDALSAACNACLRQGGPSTQYNPNAFVIPLYVYDPLLIRHETSSTAHFLFINDCLAELHEGLLKHGSRLVLRVGMLTGVLSELLQLARPADSVGSLTIWSHHVTSHNAERQRDERARSWCSKHGVKWHEFDTGGVFSDLREKRMAYEQWVLKWGENFKAYITQPLCMNPSLLPHSQQKSNSDRQHPKPLPKLPPLPPGLNSKCGVRLSTAALERLGADTSHGITREHAQEGG